MKTLKNLLLLGGLAGIFSCNNEGELDGAIVGRYIIKGKMENYQIGTEYLIAGENGRAYVIEKGIRKDFFHVGDEVVLKLKGAHVYEMYKK